MNNEHNEPPFEFTPFFAGLLLAFAIIGALLFRIMGEGTAHADVILDGVKQGTAVGGAGSGTVNAPDEFDVIGKWDGLVYSGVQNIGPALSGTSPFDDFASTNTAHYDCLVTAETFDQIVIWTHWTTCPLGYEDWTNFSVYLRVSQTNELTLYGQAWTPGSAEAGWTNTLVGNAPDQEISVERTWGGLDDVGPGERVAISFYVGLSSTGGLRYICARPFVQWRK